MKKITGNSISKATLVLAFIVITITGCKKDSESTNTSNNTPDPGAIQGTAGTPRFNLQFTNGNKTDLDLYVQTPSGLILSYGNPTGQNGRLDVDCLCGACPNGPNENIYWAAGTAARGTYKVWAEYYGDCDGSGISSNYTIRIMNNSSILQTYTGTLTPTNYKSTVYTYTY